MSKKHTEFAEQLLSARPTTRSLVMSMLMNSWPSAAAVADFGIDSQKHYEALCRPIQEAEIMPQALDAAIRDGEKLTALTKNAASNPYPNVTFRTSRDAAPESGRQDALGKRAFQEVLQGAPGHEATTERLMERELER
jgi:hypothetical protein